MSRPKLLPVTVTTPPAWAADGVCATSGVPDLWFPRYISDERAAIKACLTCPVLAACDAFATRNGERFGVWGGRARGPRRGAE